MDIKVVCKDCGENLDLYTYGIQPGAIILRVYPCLCQSSKEKAKEKRLTLAYEQLPDYLRRLNLMNFVQGKSAEIVLDYVKKDDQEREIVCTFLSFDPKKDLLYVQDREDDNTVKSLKLYRIKSVSSMGRKYELI